MAKINIKSEYITEGLTWMVILLMVIFKRFTPAKDIENSILLMYAGGVLIFALFYYYVLYKILPFTKRQWVKNIGDVVLIGILVVLARNFGVYLTALFFMPIAGSMLVLGTANSLLIAILAVVIVAFNFFMVQDKLVITATDQYAALWPIISLIIIIVYTRSLAHQIAYQKSLRSDAVKELAFATKKMREFEDLEKEFVSLTAHQLFTPLSVIRGFLSMMRQGDLGPVNGRQRKYLDESYEYTVRMIHLIKELLNISRIESGHYQIQIQPTNIHDVVEDVLKELSPVAESRQIKFNLKTVEAQHTEALADKEKTPEIFLNIVNNAIKYSYPNSHIEVTIQVVHKESKKFIQITIQDHGIGIPEKEQSHIFQRFFRATNILSIDNQGTGLGLFIAKQLVEQQGGSISFESHENEGTTFVISLPAAS